MLLNCISVGLGGFVGSVLRYLCGFLKPDGSSFPFATLGINIVGSFAIMFIVGLSAKILFLDERWMLFLKVGLCGGFTTFSTFSAETLGLFEQGNIAMAIIYAVLSFALCISAAFLGEAASSLIAGQA